MKTADLVRVRFHGSDECRVVQIHLLATDPLWMRKANAWLTFVCPTVVLKQVARS